MSLECLCKCALWNLKSNIVNKHAMVIPTLKSDQSAWSIVKNKDREKFKRQGKNNKLYYKDKFALVERGNETWQMRPQKKKIVRCNQFNQMVCLAKK